MEVRSKLNIELNQLSIVFGISKWLSASSGVTLQSTITSLQDIGLCRCLSLPSSLLPSPSPCSVLLYASPPVLPSSKTFRSLPEAWRGGVRCAVISQVLSRVTSDVTWATQIINSSQHTAQPLIKHVNVLLLLSYCTKRITTVFSVVFDRN